MILCLMSEVVCKSILPPRPIATGGPGMVAPLRGGPASLHGGSPPRSHWGARQKKTGSGIPLFRGQAAAAMGGGMFLWRVKLQFCGKSFLWPVWV